MENNMHLDIYEDRSVLHNHGKVTVFEEGTQSQETNERYRKITECLEAGYLDEVIINLSPVDYEDLADEKRIKLKALVDGITSEVGRALVGLTVLQLTIKSIVPEQNIRLHKGSNFHSLFSWKNGLSMRTIDRKYNTPFLRKHDLLSLNRDGVFMTRSLAENYPYSSLYKAKMRGPFKEWVEIVDEIELDSIPGKCGLCYLLTLLKNRTDTFKKLTEKAINLAKAQKVYTLENAQQLLQNFFNSTNYSARAFEVVVHSFLQAMIECDYLEFNLIPISQMRSANKKHGNIGDVELTDNNEIIESWDCKYGKPYLRDELEELKDKLMHHEGVKTAGFLVDSEIDLRKDIVQRTQDIGDMFGINIKLMTFKEWVEFKTKKLNEKEKNLLGAKWLLATVESFGQKRPEIAPIDEPCDNWIEDLIMILET